MSISRLRGFVIYIAIGVAVVVGVCWGASHFGRAPESLWKWIGLAGMTPILFGYAIQDHWSFRHRTSFWLTACGLLFVHVSAFSIILIHVEHWGLLWFVFAFPVESVIIDITFALTGHKRTSRRTRATVSHGDRR